MHPDWSVQLIHQDGTESFSELYHLSPNFMAIKINNLDPGEYFLTFSFPFSKLRQSLLFLSLLTLLSLFFICHSAGIFIFRKIQTIKKIHFFFLFFCLFFLFLFGIAKTEGFFTANLPRGGDFIGHYIVLEEVYSSITHFFTDSISLDSNSLAWFSHANAGYPLFYYYQPIGYILFALLYLPFSLSSLSLLSFYKIGIAIAYALLPLSIYFSCRFFGFGKKCALYTAGIFFFVSSKEIYEVIGTFGFEGIFTYGLFTHLLALLLFPVTIGLYYKCLYRTFLLHHLNTEGASLSSNIWRLHSLCIILLALLFYTHILIGALAFFSVAVLFFTLFFFTREKKKLLLIFSVHLLLFFLLITPLLYPAVRTVDYYGGLTLSYETYLTGFGKFFLTDYFHGEFLDHNRALPLITILSIFGFLFFIFSAAKYRSEFLDEAYQKNIPFFFFILALFFISLCFVTGTFSFLQKIPFLSLYPLGKNILLAQFTLLLFAGVAVEKIDSFFHSLANKYNAAHTYNAQRYLFFFYALLLFLAIAFSVPYSRALSFSLTDQHAKILEDLEDLKEQSQNNMRVYIYEDMNKRQTLMPELVVLYSKKPVFNTINGFHETLSVPYLWFYAREIQPTFWLDELFATGYELTFDKQTVRNYTSILSTRDEYTLYAINTSGYFSVIAGDTALFMEHHDAIDFVKDWIKSAMPLYNQHLVLINDYGTVKNISDINATLYNFSNYIIRNPQQKDNYLFYGNPDTGKLLDSLFQWDAKAGEAGQFISTIPQDASTVSQCSHISLLQQTMQKNQYSTVVQVNKNNNKQKYCFLLLKVSMHPDWKVTIQNNGIAHTTGDTGKIYAGEAYERPIAHLSPSFMGVSLDDLAEGEYTITFTFTGKPLLRISLFLFFCLILLFFSYIPSLFSFDKKI